MKHIKNIESPKLTRLVRTPSGIKLVKRFIVLGTGENQRVIDLEKYIINN